MKRREKGDQRNQGDTIQPEDFEIPAKNIEKISEEQDVEKISEEKIKAIDNDLAKYSDESAKITKSADDLEKETLEKNYQKAETIAKQSKDDIEELSIEYGRQTTKIPIKNKAKLLLSKEPEKKDKKLVYSGQPEIKDKNRGKSEKLEALKNKKIESSIVNASSFEELKEIILKNNISYGNSDTEELINRIDHLRRVKKADLQMPPAIFGIRKKVLQLAIEERPFDSAALRKILENIILEEGGNITKEIPVVEDSSNQKNREELNNSKVIEEEIVEKEDSNEESSENKENLTEKPWAKALEEFKALVKENKKSKRPTSEETDYSQVDSKFRVGDIVEIMGPDGNTVKRRIIENENNIYLLESEPGEEPYVAEVVKEDEILIPQEDEILKLVEDGIEVDIDDEGNIIEKTESTETEKKTEENVEDIENIEEEIKSQEFHDFFEKLELKDLQDIKKLKEKFNEMMDGDVFDELNINVKYAESIKDKYFKNFVSQAELILRQNIKALENKETSFKTNAKKELKTLGKTMWGGAAFTLAGKLIDSAALPGIGAVIGGVKGASVAGFNHVLGKGWDKLTAKNIKKLAKKADKMEGQGIDKKNIFNQLKNDLTSLLHFDQKQNDILDSKKSELDKLEEEDVNKIFRSKKNNRYEKSNKKEGIQRLFELTLEAKNTNNNATIKERQDLIKTLSENNALEEYVTFQISKQVDVLASEQKLDDADRNQLFLQAQLMVSHDMNTILGDVVAQEKFDEIEQKGKTAYQRSYVAKLFNQDPPESLMQAISKGFTSGAIVGGISNNVIAGGAYVAVQRFRGSLRSQMLKESSSEMKTAPDIIKQFDDFELDKDNTEKAEELIDGARARIKLPNITEIDRSKIESKIDLLQNKILMQMQSVETEEMIYTSIDELAKKILSSKEREIGSAIDTMKKEQARKNFKELLLTFLRKSTKEKALALAKAGGEATKGMVYGALGAELANIGEAVASGEDYDVDQGLDNIMNRATLNTNENISDTKSALEDQEEQETAKSPDWSRLDSEEGFKPMFPDKSEVTEDNDKSWIWSQDQNNNQAETKIDTLDTKSALEDQEEQETAKSPDVKIPKAIPDDEDIDLEEETKLSDKDTDKTPEKQVPESVSPEINEAKIVTIELGKEGEPQHLEQVFYRLGAENMDIGEESVTNVEASQILNIGANMRVLSEGQDIAGVKAETFQEYTSIEDGKIIIKDYEGFQNNIIEPLLTHAEESITTENVGNTGAVACVDNMLNSTWGEILAPIGITEEQLNFDQEQIDAAEERLFQDTLMKSGLGELVTDIDFDDEASGTFMLDGAEIEVQNNEVIRISGTKLNETIPLRDEEARTNLIDMTSQVKASEALVMKNLTKGIDSADIMEKNLSGVETLGDQLREEAAASAELNKTLDKLGFGDKYGKAEWEFLQKQSVDDLLNEEIEDYSERNKIGFHSERSHRLMENANRDNMRHFIQQAIDKGEFSNQSQTVGEAIKELVEQKSTEKLATDTELAKEKTTIDSRKINSETTIPPKEDAPETAEIKIPEAILDNEEIEEEEPKMATKETPVEIKAEIKSIENTLKENKDTSNDVESAPILENEKLDKFSSPDGRFTIEFKYDQNGNVSGEEIIGNMTGHTQIFNGSSEERHEAITKVVEEAIKNGEIEEKDKSIAKASATDYINKKALEIDARRIGLGILEENGKGNSAEAERFIQKINSLVKNTENQFGDIFNDEVSKPLFSSNRAEKISIDTKELQENIEDYAIDDNENIEAKITTADMYKGLFKEELKVDTIDSMPEDKLEILKVRLEGMEDMLKQDIPSDSSISIDDVSRVIEERGQILSQVEKRLAEIRSTKK